MKPSTKRKIPTASEVLARQAADHAPGGISAPKPPTPGTAVSAAHRPSTAVAVADQRDSVQQYLDEVAPASIVGRMVKFSKEGKFVTHDDGQAIPEDAEFVALCDQTLVGMIKFNGEGEPPDRVMGLLYDGFRMPPRESSATLIKASGPLASTSCRKIRGSIRCTWCCRTPPRWRCSRSLRRRKPVGAQSAIFSGISIACGRHTQTTARLSVFGSAVLTIPTSGSDG